MLKFLCTANLNREDGCIFLPLAVKNPSISKHILFYVYGVETAFMDTKDKNEEAMKKVLSYGQNSNQGCEGEQPKKR